MGKLPAYLAETGYKNPDDQADGPLQYRYGAQGQAFFQILVVRPKLLSAFSNLFEGDRGGRPDWVDWFPVQDKLLDDLRRPIAPDSILYVDVAGGRGHDLLAFKKKFDHVPGKYCLFDIPHIVDDLTLDLGDRGGVGLLEEAGEARDLVGLADGLGGAAEGVEGEQEAAVGAVPPRDGALAAPAGGASRGRPPPHARGRPPPPTTGHRHRRARGAWPW